HRREPLEEDALVRSIDRDEADLRRARVLGQLETRDGIGDLIALGRDHRVTDAREPPEELGRHAVARDDRATSECDGRNGKNESQGTKRAEHEVFLSGPPSPNGPRSRGESCDGGTSDARSELERCSGGIPCSADHVARVGASRRFRVGSLRGRTEECRPTRASPQRGRWGAGWREARTTPGRAGGDPRTSSFAGIAAGHEDGSASRVVPKIPGSRLGLLSDDLSQTSSRRGCALSSTRYRGLPWRSSTVTWLTSMPRL